MIRWTTICVAGMIAMPAYAGSKPPRFDIRLMNPTTYPSAAFFFNNNDTSRVVEVVRVDLAPSSQGTGHCDTNGSCYVKLCVWRLAPDAVGDASLSHVFSGSSNCVSTGMADLIGDKGALYSSSCIAVGADGKPQGC